MLLRSTLWSTWILLWFMTRCRYTVRPYALFFLWSAGHGNDDEISSGLGLAKSKEVCLVLQSGYGNLVYPHKSISRCATFWHGLRQFLDFARAVTFTDWFGAAMIARRWEVIPRQHLVYQSPIVVLMILKMRRSARELLWSTKHVPESSKHTVFKQKVKHILS